jgi:hypothetical protein
VGGSVGGLGLVFVGLVFVGPRPAEVVGGAVSAVGSTLDVAGGRVGLDADGLTADGVGAVPREVGAEVDDSPGVGVMSVELFLASLPQVVTRLASSSPARI